MTSNTDNFLAVQTESDDPAFFQIERDIIEAAGGSILIKKASSQEERADLLKSANAVLVGGAKIDGGLLDQCPDLQLIVRYGVGLDSLDIPAATERGIVVAHYPDFCQPEVANHALLLLLSVARKVVTHDRSIREGNYRAVPLGYSPPLTGETLGIIALGNIGRQMATRAKGIGMSVMAFDPYLPDSVFSDMEVARAESMEELLELADHVTVHTPLNDETRGLMDEDAFRRMKSTAIYVNTARGPVHNQEDLVNALESGQILGAGLDVFDPEPLSVDSKLVNMDNVVLTPHSAFYSERSNTNIKNRVGQTVAQVIAGKWPTSVATVPNKDQVIPKKRLV
jgi:D-3-phosphoglycerate dehydrogenase